MDADVVIDAGGADAFAKDSRLDRRLVSSGRHDRDFGWRRRQAENRRRAHSCRRPERPQRRAWRGGGAGPGNDRRRRRRQRPVRKRRGRAMSRPHAAQRCVAAGRGQYGMRPFHGDVYGPLPSRLNSARILRSAAAPFATERRAVAGVLSPREEFSEKGLLMRGFAALVAYVLSITCVSAVLIAALTIIISPVDDSHAPVIQPANAHAAPRSPGKHVQQNQEAKPP